MASRRLYVYATKPNITGPGSQKTAALLDSHDKPQGVDLGGAKYFQMVCSRA